MKSFWKRYKKAHDLWRLAIWFPSSLLASVVMFWIEEKIKKCKL